MTTDISVWDIVTSLVAVAALGISLFVLVQDTRRYNLPLQISIAFVDVAWAKDNYSIVLPSIGFLNPSHRGQLVKHAHLVGPTGVTCKVYPWVRGEDLTVSICQSPSGNPILRMPETETLRLPLSIPPQQTASLKDSFLVYWAVQSFQNVPESQPLQFEYIVFGLDDGELARCPVELSLQELRTKANYSKPHAVHYKKTLAS